MASQFIALLPYCLIALLPYCLIASEDPKNSKLANKIDSIQENDNCQFTKDEWTAILEEKGDIFTNLHSIGSQPDKHARHMVFSDRNLSLQILTPEKNLTLEEGSLQSQRRDIVIRLLRCKKLIFIGSKEDEKENKDRVIELFFLLQDVHYEFTRGKYAFIFKMDRFFQIFSDDLLKEKEEEQTFYRNPYVPSNLEKYILWSPKKL